jgi:hypothetical protein
MNELNRKALVNERVQPGGETNSSLSAPTQTISGRHGWTSLHEFIETACCLSQDSFLPITKDQLPPFARQLLDHTKGMTLNLESVYGETLEIEILREMNAGNCYGREVVLRTTGNRSAVAYAVISICMDQFTGEQQEVIRAGRLPFGTQLGFFRIPFISIPSHFFYVAAETASRTQLGRLDMKGPLFGRFNQMIKPTGEAQAWIMEILPGSPVDSRRN